MRSYGNKNLINERGLTLIELLMAMAISGLVASAAYTIFQSTGSASRVSENVTAVQMNLRAATDIMSRDIRQAGFGLEESPGTLTMGGGTFKAPVVVNNSATGPDSITLVGVGHFAGTLYRDPAVDCNTGTSNFICIGKVDNSTLSNGGSVIPDQRYISIAGIFFKEIDEAIGVTTHTYDDPADDPDLGNRTYQRFQIKGSSIAGANYNNGDNIRVYIIQAVQYSIATDLTGCSVTNPCLAVRDFSGVRTIATDRAVVAQHIEDLQVAYGVDASPRDGQVDYSGGSYTTDAFMSSPVADPMSIVAVRLNLVGKTPAEDSAGIASSVRPALEDRPASTPSDHHTRRVLSKVLKIRNPRS